MTIEYRDREPVKVEYSKRMDWHQEGYLVPLSVGSDCDEDFQFGTYITKVTSLKTGEVLYTRPTEVCRPANAA